MALSSFFVDQERRTTFTLEMGLQGFREKWINRKGVVKEGNQIERVKEHFRREAALFDLGLDMRSFTIMPHILKADIENGRNIMLSIEAEGFGPVVLVDGGLKDDGRTFVSIWDPSQEQEEQRHRYIEEGSLIAMAYREALSFTAPVISIGLSTDPKTSLLSGFKFNIPGLKR